MNTDYYSGTHLNQANAFKSSKEFSHFLIMSLIDAAGKPIGAYELQPLLAANGVSCSTATIGRQLKELDSAEYTIQQSNLGRILTPLGISVLNSQRSQLDRAKIHGAFSKALYIHQYDELIDLIYARKIIEPAIAFLAAENATEQEILELSKHLEKHRVVTNNNQDPTDAALDFHTYIGKISHSKSLNAMLNVLIFEEKRVESTFESLLTRERGRSYVVEHSNIFHAIQARNPEKARDLMEQHIQVLYCAIVEQINSL